MAPNITQSVPEALRALKSQPVFGELLNSQERQVLLDHSCICHKDIGDVLCRQQEYDNQVYIIVVGEVEVAIQQAGKEMKLATLGQGELFGEIGALFKLPRVSTVTVSKPSVILEIPSTIFETVVLARSELRDAVWQRYHRRIGNTALRMVRQFCQLPDEALDKLQSASTLTSYPAGQLILEEGWPADALHIIISGTTTVSHRVNGQAIVLAKMQAGEYFGEWSMLTGAPCAASVTADTNIDVLSIDRVSFFRFIQDHPIVRERIDQVAHHRHAQALHMDKIPIAANSLPRI